MRQFSFLCLRARKINLLYFRRFVHYVSCLYQRLRRIDSFTDIFEPVHAWYIAVGTRHCLHRARVLILALSLLWVLSSARIGNDLERFSITARITSLDSLLRALFNSKLKISWKEISCWHRSHVSETKRHVVEEEITRNTALISLVSCDWTLAFIIHTLNMWNTRVMGHLKDAF